MVKPAHAGVHVCVAKLPLSNVSIPIEIYALAVRAKIPNYNTFAGKHVTLECNNFLLTQIIPNLTVFWYKDDKLYLRKSSYINFASTNLYFDHLSAWDSGIYECRLYDRVQNRTWTTNMVNLHVQSVLSIFRNHIVSLLF